MAEAHRPILLAWAGMVVLHLVTALFSPGFLSASNLHSVLILASFVGIVALDEGCYWVTIPVTSKVSRYDPDGKLMQSITLPTDLPTCCGFGGPDLDILYVTAAVLRRPKEHFRHQQHPRGLFAVRTGHKGLPLPAFQG